jgi:hypothetical protein
MSDMSEIAGASQAIHLSLVSHTNIGKTALARTLLGQDVGEVRDAAHVTDEAASHMLLQTPQGDELQLWDTPGFGDSTRLLRRLRQSDRPLGWLLAQAWDRWRDRPFWASQQAMRHVVEQADVMLYLVSAAEAPTAAAYVDSEMDLLEWVDKPVIVLLNQLGAPREAALEAAEIEAWRQHLAARAFVKQVLPMDAFARCWVQESVLLRAVEAGVADDQRAPMARLIAQWQAQRLATFDASVQLLADSMTALAAARQDLSDVSGLKSKLRALGRAMGISAAESNPTALAQAALAAQLEHRSREDITALIRLHGLAGQAQAQIVQRLATHYEARLRMDESKAAWVGGALAGALAGLKADIATGGLTLGGGALAGGLLGALGGAGLARCVNLVRGIDASWLAWNAEALDAMLEAALLRYLAVAHFGRGRGEWVASETPAHWQGVVAAVLATQRAAITSLWQQRGNRQLDDGAVRQLASQLRPLIDAALREVLLRLYPQAPVPRSD